MDIPHSQRRQRPPYQRERHADPAVQIHLGGAVIPEQNAQQPLIEEVDDVLHRRGRQAAVQCQTPECAGHVRRQMQHRQHGKAVHRTQRQQQKAFPHLMGRTARRRIQLLQYIPSEAVQQKQPEPIETHTISSACDFS